MTIPPRRETEETTRRPRVIPADNVAYTNPGRQPLGRSPALRDARGYLHAETDGTGAENVRPSEEESFNRLQDIRPHTLQARDADRRAAYTDADEVRPSDTKPRKKKRRKKKEPHRGLWLTVIIVCALLLAGLGVFMAPQLFGITWSGLPNFAFMNGAVLKMDQADYANYRAYRKYMADDVIFPNVYVDDIHVGGMSVSEAKAALQAIHSDSVGTFGITVNVGDQSWLIDSTRVPMTRNYDAILEKAYGLGRVNTTSIRGTGVTPFQERLNAALALRSAPVSMHTDMTYDKDTVRALIDSIKASVDAEPISATVAAFDFNTKEFTFTADVNGRRLDADAIYEQVIGCLDSGNLFASVTAIPETLLAETTRTELMNSFKRVAAYTTETTNNDNRNTNIDLSAQAINGMTVMPGETFSFNKATGERTAAKGYKEAIAISGGQSVPDIGGGVCQTSSTLFNAVARANLEIVSRSPHAWPSSYVEKGMDATVNWPGLDFCFKNNTDWPVFIVSWYASRKVTVELYGIGLGDGVTIDLQSVVTKTIPIPSGQNRVLDTSLASGTEKVTIKARAGYEVETYKIWYKNGEETSRELLCKSTYKAYQETVAYND